MANYSIKAETESGLGVEYCLDPALIGLKQGTVTLEQKVTQLFETLRDPVYRYLVVSFDNPAEAEEITQEAFFRLYRQLRSGQTVENARAWVFRVAHNLAVDRLRDSDKITLIDSTTWDEIAESRQDTALNPEQRLLQLEKFERLHGAMGLLSHQQRQCLQLRAEGFRYREIAEILGIDISSVYEFLRRAIKRLTVKNHG
jgi:RNA polymerase sigma-70 factor (ECF subfamily)